MINKIKKLIHEKNLDGYIVPKNDDYFTEYSKKNNLKLVANFTGSAGFALVLKKKNYLFVDGRYTLQAQHQSGKEFQIVEFPYIWPKDIIKKIDKNLKIGFDPNLFTYSSLSKYFENICELIPIKTKLFKSKENLKNVKSFFKLSNKIVGENIFSKISKIKKFLKKCNIDYLFVSAGENVCWILNIRGYDLPNSPVANCKIIISKQGKIFFFSKKYKIENIKKKFIKLDINFKEEKELFNTISNLKNGSFCIDKNTCSVFNENLIKSKFKIKKYYDPTYFLKSIKNKTEIKNMINCHIEDGVALTRFLYWIKNNKKLNLTEIKVEKKLENFRKKNKNFLYPSFNTIAGSGPNGAIIHYRSTKKSNRKILKNDLLLVDSGGQYKWGTTDVTRTISFIKQNKKIKENFTRVLKGHINMALADINRLKNGHNIDKIARKSLRSVGLDYRHGTGHGVGFFLNVHEGPQSISKNNMVNLQEGMIVSNEPGYYLKNKYGIRIENLVYIKKIGNKLKFQNLTLAPIDKDLINFKMLNYIEKDYLFKYHLEVYSRISPYLNSNEKKWLSSFIY